MGVRTTIFFSSDSPSLYLMHIQTHDNRRRNERNPRRPTPLFLSNEERTPRPLIKWNSSHTTVTRVPRYVTTPSPRLERELLSSSPFYRGPNFFDHPSPFLFCTGTWVSSRYSSKYPRPQTLFTVPDSTTSVVTLDRSRLDMSYSVKSFPSDLLLPMGRVQWLTHHPCCECV